MKKSTSQFPPEKTIADLANLAWCALISLRIAQQNGLALTPFTVHSFLMRWLVTVQKQRRFPRTVAEDIEGLLRLGRQQGHGACLYDRLNYLWESCSGRISQQSDLFRLTYAIEHLKSQGWTNAAVSDSEWILESLLSEYAGEQALLAKKSELTQHFSPNGLLQKPIDFFVVGNGIVASETLDTRKLKHVMEEHNSGRYIITLIPPALTGTGGEI
ncbi:DUF2913 family protein [Trabulsiella odontotermitis]|uniref:DUF2913 family protein n=1 Tax=Trabulsiella odontotermitis TaxID=379893 RepID=UPI00092F68E0|nr:DUF2913 family protein [Trabulsiella odontotermitis]